MSDWSWERFSDGARRVVLLAHEQAMALKQEEVDVGHLLVGLLRERDGVGGRVLSSFGLSVAQVVPRLEVGAGGEDFSAKELSFTRGASEVLVDALREALTRGRGYIATEHMLLGLVRDPDGAGARFLVGVGVEPERVRARVLREAKKAPVRRTDHLREPLPAPVGRELLGRLTDRAREAVAAAGEEARELNHYEVGTEHLLLGLLQVEGLAARVLEACEVTYSAVRAEFTPAAEPPRERSDGALQLSLLAGRALARAAGQAPAGEEIGTAHVLQGIIGVRESRAPVMLVGLGIYLERLREASVQALESGEPPQDAAQLVRTAPG
ncbi:MAG: Clp protease N-terminal domain-containing protein, partial [Gammaproteobacteria bacterium]